MYSPEEIENFRMIFVMFDAEHSGFVGVKDLETILKSLGRDPSEANDLVADMNLADERLSFTEFLKIMKALESRLTAKDDKDDDEEDELEPIEGTLEDRNKFGALLPRTGVHFLPDTKVVDFLRYVPPPPSFIMLPEVVLSLLYSRGRVENCKLSQVYSLFASACHSIKFLTSYLLTILLKATVP